MGKILSHLWGLEPSLLRKLQELTLVDLTVKGKNEINLLIFLISSVTALQDLLDSFF